MKGKGSKVWISKSRQAAYIFALSFLLNYVWEHAHSVLYTNYQGVPISEWILFRATLGDACIITAISLPFLFIPFLAKRSWLILPIGIVWGILIELTALASGRWGYGPNMPLVPFLHTGLSPTLQLGVLGYACFVLVRYATRAR